MPRNVKLGFDPTPVQLPIARLMPSKVLPKALTEQEKYRRLAASIREVGIIEPVMVAPLKDGKGKNRELLPAPTTYTILDGHVRVRVLQELGQSSAPCLIASDDEGYTYNRHVNGLSTIQEHFMIIKALGSVSEERLARAFAMDVRRLREKRDLLNGICPEAVDLLKDKAISGKALRHFKQVKPLRQIEMAELMTATGNYSESYAQALYLGTTKNQLLETGKEKAAEGLSASDIARMEKEMETVEQDFALVKEAYGDSNLHLVVVRSYLARLLDNARIVRYLSQQHPEYLAEFQKIVEMTGLEG